MMSMKKRQPRKIINWNMPRAEAELARQIAQRASNMATEAGFEYLEADAQMDITAAHLNGCPLDLARLLAADNANFGHDVFGIRRNLNRTTGELDGFFVPRHAQPETDPVRTV